MITSVTVNMFDVADAPTLVPIYPYVPAVYLYEEGPSDKTVPDHNAAPEPLGINTIPDKETAALSLDEILNCKSVYV